MMMAGYSYGYRYGITAWPVGGGGPAPFFALADIDLSIAPASIIEVDVTGMRLFQVALDRVSHEAATQIGMQFSIDGGATWFNTSGDYVDVGSAGTQTNNSTMIAHFSDVSGIRSGNFTVWQPGGGIIPQIYSQANSKLYMFLGSLSPINRIRIFGGTATSGTPNASLFTGGQLQVWGKE